MLNSNRPLLNSNCPLLNAFIDFLFIFCSPFGLFTGQRRGVTHVSRLQCVQSAVEQQIEKVAREHPNKHVGLITFNNDVTLVGDGKVEPVVVTGDHLNSYEELNRIGTNFKLNHVRSRATHPTYNTRWGSPPSQPRLFANIIQPVHQVKSSLLKRLWDLEETGSTALGPALQLAIVIAGARPGSAVILCTDGLANTGIGALTREGAAC